jgi:PhnB protein
VESARTYLEFLNARLGGEIADVHTSPDGIVRNAHVRFDDPTIMVSEAGDGNPASPGTFYLYVEDADLALRRATEAGGEEVMAVDFRPYGEWQGGVRDMSGNVWWLSQRLVPRSY